MPHTVETNVQNVQHETKDRTRWQELLGRQAGLDPKILVILPSQGIDKASQED